LFEGGLLDEDGCVADPTFETAAGSRAVPIHRNKTETPANNAKSTHILTAGTSIARPSRKNE
jgi:hypothetical protein